MNLVSPSGVAARYDDASQLECRICWYLYDPAEGDAVEQIPPGTPFSKLPDHWRCPQCDAERHSFLPVSD